MTKTLLTLSNVSKRFADTELFKIKHLDMQANDKIAIIGPNGCGKTTLLKMIAQELEPDTGSIRLEGRCTYFKQPEGAFHEVDYEKVDPTLSSMFNINDNDGYSGGEKTKRAFLNALSQTPDLLCLDEPTTNVDMDTLVHIEEIISDYPHALLVVSHDVEFINRVADKLWIIHEHEVRVFDGTYDEWERQKELELDTQSQQYHMYKKEKKRLEQEAIRVREQAQNMLKKPKNMASKERRLYAMTASIQQGHVQRRSRQLLSRIGHLDPIKRPKLEEPMNISLGSFQKIGALNACVLESFSLEVGHKQLLENVSYNFEANKRTALIGKNGVGKTMLLNAILENAPGITNNPKLKFGLFSQFHEVLDLRKTVLDAVMQTSIYDQSFVRNVLNNLGFKKEAVYKSIAMLSGGEKAKAVLAILITSDVNILILDEPTNHLDLKTKKAMIKMLKAWEHTMIFVSHDRYFIQMLADRIVRIEDRKLQTVPIDY